MPGLVIWIGGAAFAALLVALALQPFARQLAGPADGFGPLAGLALGGLFVTAAELHLAEDALALHLLLERAQGLVDVVVANDYLNDLASSFSPRVSSG